MKIGWPHLLVMRWGVMFGMIIYQILGSRSSVNDKLALLGPILDPIKTHVNSLGSFLFYGAIGESDSKSVVDLHGSGRLGMPHFLKILAERDVFLPIDVGSSHFCFIRGAHDVAQYFGNDMDISVWWTLDGIGSIGIEEKWPPAQLRAFGAKNRDRHCECEGSCRCSENARWHWDKWRHS